MLGGLALQLAGAGDADHQRDVDVHDVLPGQLAAHLTDGLQEGLAFDVAHGAADLGDAHVHIAGLAHAVNALFDLVGDVGDDLNGAAEVLALTLPVQHVPVDLTGGDGGVDGQALIGKALVVAQIQIGLGAVIGDEHLAVLVGAHGARVHVQVGIQLLVGHLQAALLQQTAQGSGGDALAKAGNHATGDKNVFHRHGKASF